MTHEGRTSGWGKAAPGLVTMTLGLYVVVSTALGGTHNDVLSGVLLICVGSLLIDVEIIKAMLRDET